MKRLARIAAALAVAGGLLAVPGTSLAADAPQRVADLNSNGPGMYSPYKPATGRAVITLYPNAQKVCYSYRWQKMPLRALYLYRLNTQQVVTKLYDEYERTDGFVRGCVTEVPTAQVREFIQYPKRFYIKAQDYSGRAQISGVVHRPAA